jgi:hypothetical protein
VPRGHHEIIVDERTEARGGGGLVHEGLIRADPLGA